MRGAGGGQGECGESNCTGTVIIECKGVVQASDGSYPELQIMFSVYLSDVWTALFKKTLAPLARCGKEVCFLLARLCLAVIVPWLEDGPHHIYESTFLLLLPPYCAEFGESHLTVFHTCCHQGRAWARAAPYSTQPVLSTEVVKSSLVVVFLVDANPRTWLHSARTVPAQCPHSARNSARTVPAGKNCIVVQTRQKESLLR